jgi:c-di-GMP-binding flagellar brake protein YcgR
MQMTVANQKHSVVATVQEIENHVLILECKESYYFKLNDHVNVSVHLSEDIRVIGQVIASNPDKLLVLVSESALSQLHLADRRNYTRYSLPSSIACVLYEHHSSGFTKRYIGAVHDISINGMKVTAEYPLTSKDKYELSIQSDSPILAGFSAEIVVRNARMDYELDTKSYGVIIETISDKNQELLDRFIAELQQQLYHKPNFFHKLRSMIS